MRPTNQIGSKYFVTTDEILKNVTLSEDLASQCVVAMSPVGRAMHYDKFHNGYHPIHVSWPDGISGIMYCEPGTTLPHPQDVVAVYKKSIQLRAIEIDSTNSLTVKRRQVATASAAAIDTVTILQTKPGHLATKKFIKPSAKAEIAIQPYDAGILYKVLGIAGVNNINDLSVVLQYCEQNPNALIIRGEPVTDEVLESWVRRKGSGVGEAFQGNFMTPINGRHYFEIDIDKLTLPTGWELDQTSIRKICEHLVHLLPPEFHEASYHWQLSSSAGVFDISKVSAHLWFWLTRPVPDADLKVWAKRVNNLTGIKLVDGALFQHVQPHYVAAPIFEGMDDPFPIRSGLVSKLFNSVDLQTTPPISSENTEDMSSRSTLMTTIGSGFEYHLGQIGDHSGGDGFHMPIVQAAASYVAEHGTENLDVEKLFQMIQQRVQTADSTNHSKSEVIGRARREHIMPAITSAIRKYGEAANQRRKSRRLIGITPDTHAEYQDVAAIQSNIDAMLDRIFLP